MSKYLIFFVMICSGHLLAQELNLGVSHNGSWLTLPRIVVADSQGELRESDREGKVDVSHMSRPLYLLTDRGSFEYKNTGTSYFSELSSGDSIGGRVNLSRFFQKEHMVTWSALEGIRNKVLNALPSLNSINWFDSKIPVDLQYSDGCNAAFDGRELLLFTGDETCIASSLSKDLIIHEYGHALIGHLTNNYKSYEQDYGEGFSDSLMAIVGHDPHFGEGLYPGRINSHIRDLRYFVTYPDGWRGLYSGSLIFSTLVWKMHELLSDEFSEVQLENLLLKSLLLSTAELTSGQTPQIVEGSKLFIKVLNAQLSKKGRADLICLGELELERRGLSERQSSCSTVTQGHTFQHRVIFPQQNIQYPAIIPDRGHLNLGFQIPRVSRPIKRIELHLNIDHMFPDDLLVNYEIAGRKHHIYKGIEELEVPSSLEIPALKVSRGKLTILLEDSQDTFEGVLKSKPSLIIYY